MCRNEPSCPEREWRIIDCSKDDRLVCRIQPEVCVHLLKSGLPMSTWLAEETFGGQWKARDGPWRSLEPINL